MRGLSGRPNWHQTIRCHKVLWCFTLGFLGWMTIVSLQQFGKSSRTSDSEFCCSSNEKEKSESAHMLKSHLTTTSSLDVALQTSTNFNDQMDDHVKQFAVLVIPVYCGSKRLYSITNSRRPIRVRFEVDFSVLYISVLIKLTGCTADSLILDNVTDKARNFSVGLGENSLNLPVSFTTAKSLKIRRNVQITVTRWNRGFRPHDPVPLHNLSKCYLKQSCKFLLNSLESCDLQRNSSLISWSEFIHDYSLLPSCSLKEAQTQRGTWAVPCIDCSNPVTCHWHKAQWTVDGCRMDKVPLNNLRNIVQDKTILFVGDSTVRGIMYSLVESLNQSVHSWSKAHNKPLVLSGFPELENTILAFIYYPQFWNPTEEQPNLNDTVARLFSRVSIRRDRPIILVVGGAQWLTLQQIDELALFLKVEGLRPTVIVKDYGAGFHLPVEDVTYKSLSSQRTLTALNSQLIDMTRQNGFLTLPTFHMTWSRLEEFHPGKCACHFHTVLRRWASSSPPPSISRVGSNGVQYFVTGPIHTAYTELFKYMLTQIYGNSSTGV